MFEGYPEGFHALIQGGSRGIGLACVRQLLAAPRVRCVIVHQALD